MAVQRATGAGLLGRAATRFQFSNQLRHGRLSGEQKLDAVVAGRIVRGRDHGDTAAAHLPRSEEHGWRRLLADVVDGEAGVEQPFDEGLFERRRAAAEVSAHADRRVAASPDQMPQRTADATGLVGSPLLAHHAANVTRFEDAHDAACPSYRP